MRLKILFGQDCHTYPMFTTEELAETLEETPQGIECRAANEGWQSFEVKEALADGADSYWAWDALSMPVATRRLIAAFHYLSEEEEYPLLAEAEEAILNIQRIFPEMDFPTCVASLYRARQFSLVYDVMHSLRLTLPEALDVISYAFDIGGSLLVDLNRELDGGVIGSFIQMSEDERFAVFQLYFSRCSGVFLPEFSPEETALEPEEAAQ